jgi:hypothetical protein
MIKPCKILKLYSFWLLVKAKDGETIFSVGAGIVGTSASTMAVGAKDEQTSWGHLLMR